MKGHKKKEKYITIKDNKNLVSIKSVVHLSNNMKTLLLRLIIYWDIGSLKLKEYPYYN